MDRRFLALRVIATILKILAWLALGLGILAAIGALVASFLVAGDSGVLGLGIGDPLAGVAVFVAMLILAILFFLFLYASSEFIYLFLSIEENTRRTAYFFQQQYIGHQTPYAGGPSNSPQDSLD
jgi:uncharacterized membrane protein YhdT